MHFARMRLGRRRNRIKARGNFVGQGQEFSRGKGRREFNQHIGVVTRENVIIKGFLIPHDLRQLRLLLPIRQLFQQGLDELLAHAIQAVLGDQQLAQIDRAGRQLHRGRCIEAQVGQQFIDNLGEIPGNDAQRIARRVLDATLPQVNDDVAGILGGPFGSQGIVGGDLGLERIGPVVNGRSGWCAQISEVSG